MKAVDGQLLRERRARSTGTVVQLVYTPSADEGNPWETICVDHGGVCSHETRKMAEGWLSHPDEWCEDCMYGPGTLSGQSAVPDVSSGSTTDDDDKEGPA